MLTLYLLDSSCILPVFNCCAKII